MSVAVAPSPPKSQSEAAFIRQAHDIVRDLMPHRESIYWCDFLGSMALGLLGLYFYIAGPLVSWPALAGFLVAGFMLYRASIFTHELAHMAPSRYRAFRFAWNLLFGIPFLMPSFFYTDHRVHHVNQLYGTPGDAEYYPYATMSVRSILLGGLMIFLVPLMLVARFSLLTIGSLLSPRIRTWTWQKASSLGNMNPRYVRALADADERFAQLWQEAACFAVVATLIGMTIAGIVSWQALAKIYTVYLLVTFVNQLRVFAAHHYGDNPEPMPFLEQMLDSTTIPGGPWSALWAPLGMRYHALHHLFPAMPYHAMGAAHRRLVKQLPPDSPYHATLRPSLFSAIGELFRAARAHTSRPQVPAA